MPLHHRDLIEEAKPYIDYKKDPATKIAYLTFKRPKDLNAVTTGMRLLYADLVHAANIDDEVKVLVIRSEGIPQLATMRLRHSSSPKMCM